MNTVESSSKRPLVDVTAIQARAIEIMRNPLGIWPKIKVEQISIKDLFIGYLMPLAAIGPIAYWLGMMLFGLNVYGMRIRIGFFTGLVHALLMYAVLLTTIFVSAQIISRIAPKFGGSISIEDSLKWFGYSLTPFMLGGAFLLIPSIGLAGQVAPSIGILQALLGGYGAYIFVNGVGPMSGVPDTKKWPFVGLCLGGALLTAAILVWIVGRVLVSGNSMPSDVQIDLGNMGDVLKNIEQNLPKQ